MPAQGSASSSARNIPASAGSSRSPRPLRDPTRLSSTPPRSSYSTSSTSTTNRRSVSPSTSTRSGSSSRRRLSTASKENEPITKSQQSTKSAVSMSEGKMNGDAHASAGVQQVWRDGSLEPEDSSTSELRKRTSARQAKSPSPSHSKSASSSGPHGHYNGLPTLPPISDDGDGDYAIVDSPTSEKGSSFRPPPPAPSAAMGTGDRPVTRPRRSSSIKRKLSPGVRPVKAVDWEIPRKTLHSSIGFLALFLYYLEPPSVRPLVVLLSASLVVVTIADFLRFNYPAFREAWEANLGFLMRESERNKINGVVYYLVGVISVLLLYPREVAVVSILTLSWSDTTASTIGRLWGRYTPPLPAHLPLVPVIKFAPRKSLAGFLAATFTGAAICLGFWRNGSDGNWAILNEMGRAGLVLTAGVVGVGGAIAEAFDLGLDDNLTLPILSGGIIWVWLHVTQLFLGRV